MMAARGFGFHFGVPVVLGLVWAGAAASADPLFPGVQYPAGHIPHSIAISDLDGDGDADLAVPNRADDNLSILLNPSGVDCNSNGIPDECDIDCGTSGGPCDVPGCGQSEDCQPNGVPDECEIEPIQSGKLLAADGSSYDYFGQSVAVSGHVAIVGAPEDGVDRGTAYVFRYKGNTWAEEAKLLATDGANWDYFGESVAVSGHIAVVGARMNDDLGVSSGSVYVFRYDGSTWVQEAKLLAADGASGNYFGSSVAVWGDVAVVGADGDDDLGTLSGSVYVFRYDGSTWVQETKLLAADGRRNARFGRAVAVSSDVAVVGTTSGGPGSAYVFRYTGGTWLQEAKLLPADGVKGDLFGSSVAVSEGVAVVGACAKDDLILTDSGSAYVFRYDGSTWMQEARLLAADAAAYDNFGISVAVSGGVAVVGAYGDDDLGADSGSAYVFRHAGSMWVQEARLLAVDGTSGDDFGISVAVTRDAAIVGASGDDDSRGSSHVFPMRVPDCNANDVPDECDIAAGTSEDYDLHGVPDECQDCNENGRPDACDLACSTGNCASHPLGCGGIPDCQLNAVPDECDIAAGTSQDYDLNEVPDECQDCNENGVSDACDVSCSTGNCAGHPLGCGGSADCQPDGVPDECEVEIRQLAKLLAADGATNDFFGNSVSVYGDVALVGAYEDDDPVAGAGSAYVFRHNRGTWVQQAKLLAADGAVGDWFGWSVAVSGDLAVVGAHWDDDLGNRSGSAYVFRYNGSTWVQEAKLLAPDGHAEDYFGCSVAVSRDVVIVGAHGGRAFGYKPGAAYVFRHNGTTWVQEAKLLAADGERGDDFGVSVAVSGGVAIVGATGDDDLGNASGSAYAFRHTGTTWVQQAKLLASDGAAYDAFGMSVAVSGDMAIVGAGGGPGSAYAFRYSGGTWVQAGTLLAADGELGDRFGASVAVAGDVAVVGAHYDNDRGTNSGSAYVFRYTGSAWAQEAKLLAPDGASHDRFGTSVAVSSAVAVVGAMGAGDFDDHTGAAYVFATPDCNANGLPDDCDITAGTSADCQLNGAPDECDIAAGISDDANTNGIPDECEPGLDIKPGACPNPFNRRSHGVLPVALVGREDFDVIHVDASSVRLSRADGMGGEVAPNEGPPGPHTVVEDVAAPFDGELCDCHDATADGIDDLMLHFRTQDVVDTLALNGLDNGDFVELAVSGVLLDGTPFTAYDCILIVPQGNGNLSVTSNRVGVYVGVTPMDSRPDAGGFADFQRSYPYGTAVVLTAEQTLNGDLFYAWRVDGVMQLPTDTTLQLTVMQDMTVKAVYRSVIEPPNPGRNPGSSEGSTGSDGGPQTGEM
ncbi:MAG TPA: FG-GAP repeat protein [Phycisphaerae bacterium]|nr:FG-GAP repeat protein [Phycisphaerae bacterium]